MAHFHRLSSFLEGKGGVAPLFATLLKGFNRGFGWQDLKLILPQLAVALRWDCHCSQWPWERKAR